MTSEGNVEKVEQLNLMKLMKLVSNENEAVKYFQDKGLLHKSRKCLKGHEMRFYWNSRNWRCAKVTCRKQIHLRQDTFFHFSKLPFRNILLFMYCWSQEFTSVKFCQKELNISKNSFVEWSNFMREVCANSLMKNSSVIGGPNCTVEIKDSLFAQTKCPAEPADGAPNSWIFGGYCRETEQCFVVPMDDKSPEALVPIVERYVLPESTVITNNTALKKHLRHQAVNYKYKFPAHDDRSSKKNELAKQSNAIRRGIRKTHLDSYLCEFMWRRKYKDRDLFEKLLEDIAVFLPAT